jgi:Leucine-rich repeat (LRR) protein
VLQLAQLSALQHLELRFDELDIIMDAAPALPQLPQLNSLCVVFDNENPYTREMVTITASIAACTGLTKLELGTNSVVELENAEVMGCDELPSAVCASLACLTRLRHLCITCINCLVPGDALALIALTNLTRLAIQDAGPGVSDMVATALACNLKQLQHLELNRNWVQRGHRYSECDLDGMVCLAATRQLSQLTQLQLQGSRGLTVEGLMLLTCLPRLQRLVVEKNEEVTDAVMQRFCAAVREQQQQH